MTELRERPGDVTPLEMFDRTVGELADRPLMYSFETPISARAVESLVDGLAAGMQSLGVGRGDRIGLYLQNDPQYVIAMLAAWRIGALPVPCNPMLRHRELAHHLDDCGATALVVLDDLFEIAQQALEVATNVRLVISTRKFDLRDHPTDVDVAAASAGSHDLLTIAREHAGSAYERFTPTPQDVAVLTYTSGTTGPAKGAMNTHGNIAYAARVYRDLMGVNPDDIILGIAPLYHVTGLTGHIGLALAAGLPVILAHRFDPVVVADLVEHHRATVTVAAITAYMALANDERARERDFSSMRRTYSGGAPIPPAAIEDLRRRLGITIRPVYGLTETTGPTHMCPPDADPPIHSDTGALSVGLVVPGTEARIIGADGETLGPGVVGEIAVRGPQVVPGYWELPDETAAAIPGGELRTGDVGAIDERGWLYLVDRSKDMIIASGFKVWPREVEDVLYEHEAVREAAVIGVPDEYRGETVWAYVSLKSGHTVESSELIAHCRVRLAAYKYPRVVHILDELPKTASGKILRRELRNGAVSQ